ncbi:ABC transporter ATP-binding protein, partial [candidate division WWE3 bacterium CG_4_9_14_3_um_filter_41_6]
MNTIDPIIRFEHVSKKRGNQIILDDVTFAVEKNTLTVIQGFSGIGKTTILSLISGFERIDAGNLYVNHLLVDSHESYIQPNKRHVAMQFQGLALWPHVSALEHILFVMRNPSIDGALDVARRVGFPAKKLYTYPGELSGGERQRLALARTIATPCEIILFD